MPVYDYEDPETGVKVTLRRPVEDRNKEIVLRRLKDIPDNLVVHGAPLSPELSFDKQVLNGYRRKEEREGSRFRSAHSKKRIAEIYSEARKA